MLCGTFLACLNVLFYAWYCLALRLLCIAPDVHLSCRQVQAVCATSPWGIEDVAQIFGDLNPTTGIPEYITLGS
jgi:hypothetical protein